MASIISAGTTSGTSLNLSGDTSGVLQLATNGSTTAVTIDTSQRVGIGTASPALPLDINTGGSGSVNINGTGSGPWMRWQLSGTAFAYIGSGAQLGAGSANDFCFNSQNNMTFTSGGNSERMRITSAGNVGIGTSSPTSRLAVSYTSDASAPLTVSKAGVNFIGSSSVQLLFGSDPNSPYASYIQTSNGAGSSFPISLNPSGGNVGIGTINPVNILDIAGEGQSGVNAINFTWSTTSTGYAPVLNLKKSNGSKASPTAVSNGDQTGAIVFNGYDGSNYQSTAYIESRVDGTPGTNDMPGRLVFFTTPDGSASGTERMRITSGGLLLIGTTSGTPNPGFSFDPNGTLSIGNNAAASGFEFQTYRRSGVQIGSVYQNGTTAVLYNTTSDYRLKENIAPMTGALATVAQLKPCTYTWKVDGSAGQGFIAHELQAVVPDCVAGEKDAVETYIDEEGNEQTRIKPQGIDTSFLVATLTAAIQELKAELDATKAEVAALKGVN